jgi:hypothetical protein
LRSKDGLLLSPAHNPKVVSSNLTVATKVSFLSITSANPATIRIWDFHLLRIPRVLLQLRGQHRFGGSNFRFAVIQE